MKGNWMIWKPQCHSVEMKKGKTVKNQLRVPNEEQEKKVSFKRNRSTNKTRSACLLVTREFRYSFREIDLS